MAPALADDHPAIVFDELDHVSHLHDLSTVARTSVVDYVLLRACLALLGGERCKNGRVDFLDAGHPREPEGHEHLLTKIAQ